MEAIYRDEEVSRLVGEDTNNVKIISPCHAERSEASINEQCITDFMAAIRFFAPAQNDKGHCYRKRPACGRMLGKHIA